MLTESNRNAMCRCHDRSNTAVKFEVRNTGQRTQFITKNNRNCPALKCSQRSRLVSGFPVDGNYVHALAGSTTEQGCKTTVVVNENEVHLIPFVVSSIL